MTDWFSTLLTLGGGAPSGPVDGVDHWDNIASSGAECPSEYNLTHYLYNLIYASETMTSYTARWQVPVLFFCSVWPELDMQRHL